MKINRYKIKKYLKEIDEITYPLYLADQDINAQIAGKGWMRAEINKKKIELPQKLREYKQKLFQFARLVERTTIAVVPSPRRNLREWEFPVSQKLLAREFRKVLNFPLKPGQFTFFVMQGKRFYETDLHVFKIKDILSMKDEDQIDEILNAKPSGPVYHKARLNLSYGIFASFQFVIMEDINQVSEYYEELENESD